MGTQRMLRVETDEGGHLSPHDLMSGDHTSFCRFLPEADTSTTTRSGGANINDAILPLIRDAHSYELQHLTMSVGNHSLLRALPGRHLDRCLRMYFLD
jgi:hypothetical protein